MQVCVYIDDIYRDLSIFSFIGEYFQLYYLNLEIFQLFFSGLQVYKWVYVYYEKLRLIKKERIFDIYIDLCECLQIYVKQEVR